MSRPIRQAMLALVAGVAVLIGLILAGQALRSRLATSPRHQADFLEIDCTSPPELEKNAFLAEVRYMAELPEKLPLVDPALPATLAAAFERHPWVEHTDKVEIRADRKVTVTLTFRTPVLTVTARPPSREPIVREVDRHGVLLPHRKAGSTPFRLRTPVPAPAQPAGQPWGNPVVEDAAALASLLLPLRDPTKPLEIEAQDGEFRWREGDRVVLWGRAPGKELESEPQAEKKLQRLLKKSSPGTLDLRKE